MPRSSPRESLRFPESPLSFFRVSTQRNAEAHFLFEGERFAASIYLAGYSIECGPKALILSAVPKAGWKKLADSFRGSVWHQFDHMLEAYIRRGGPRPLASVARAFVYLNDEWTVDLRYVAGEKSYREAERFLDATDGVLEWIKGRL